MGIPLSEDSGALCREFAGEKQAHKDMEISLYHPFFAVYGRFLPLSAKYLWISTIAIPDGSVPRKNISPRVSSNSVSGDAYTVTPEGVRSAVRGMGFKKEAAGKLISPPAHWNPTGPSRPALHATFLSELSPVMRGK